MPDDSPPDRDDLVRLVATQRAALGLTYEQLALAGKACGDRDLNVHWLHRLEHGKIRTAPHKGRLRALAAALRLPARQVLEAAGAQYLDIEGDTVWNRDRTARLWIDDPASLPPEEQAKALRRLDAPGET